MRSHSIAWALSSSIALASASFDGNLNYHSPSPRHVNMGLDVPGISHRSLKRGATPYAPSDLSFTHGIASGDPYPDSVILWTRIAPSVASDTSNVTVTGNVDLYSHETESYIKADANPICLEWKVWEPATKDKIVSQGKAYTTSDIDFTVKVEAQGLQPYKTYNYQFTVCNSSNRSPVGRTKTSPAADYDLKEMRFAVFSCSNYPKGHFNAYGNAARKDKHDYVLHLGDYIYEGGQGGPRAHNPPREIFTLGDYRTRHGQYRSDPDLQLLAKDFAWITTWDDHEVADNSWKDGFTTMNNTEDSFRKDGRLISVDQRKMNAVRAYFEWMPIRQVDLDDNLRIWRSFQMGTLLDLIIIDTRNYDRSITGLGYNERYIPLIRDEANRSLMGPRQEKWFYRTLSTSSKRGATWRVIGNQIIFSRILGNGGGMSTDAWDGYVANRNRTLKHLYDEGIGNNVFLSGDNHQNWVADLAWLGTKPYDSKTGNGAIGVEFAGTAVSSGGGAAPISEANKRAQAPLDRNEEVLWNEGYYRGYFILSVGQKAVKAEYFGSPSIATRNGYDIPLANFTVNAGENHVARPIGGGKVEAGALRDGKTVSTNVTLDTTNSTWHVVGFEKMYVA
ncbi:alkaline phosphatase [Naviculisporaceae sp. PSN 640]